MAAPLHRVLLVSGLLGVLEHLEAELGTGKSCGYLSRFERSVPVFVLS